MRSNAQVRKFIRQSLPDYMFQPNPARGWRGILLIPVFIAAFWAIVFLQPPWFVCLLLSLVIGELFIAWGFLGHEALHGAIFSNSFGQHFLGYLGYVPMLISPLTWKFWHCQCHHGHTNCPGKDPDIVSMTDFSNSPVVRFFSSFIPGTHHWLSFLGLFSLFTLQGQYVLWFFGAGHGLEEKFNFNRTRAKIETVAMYIFWIGLGIAIGLKNSLYVIVIPMLLTNFVNISYISAQHMLRPCSNKLESPFYNTISVTNNRLLRFLHLQFGYHVEHHLFPNMCHQYAPHVSRILKTHFGDRYLSIPYLKALGLVLKTPRMYADSQTLIAPGTQKKVPLSTVLHQLKQPTTKRTR